MLKERSFDFIDIVLGMGLGVVDVACVLMSCNVMQAVYEPRRVARIWKTIAKLLRTRE